VPDAPLTVPGYLPAICASALPWTRRHVARVVARSGVDPRDAWDEAVCGLLRAALGFREGSGTFLRFAQTCIRCGVHRYVERAAISHRRRGRHDPLDAAPIEGALTSPSAEAEVIAREAAAGALLLRQHAALSTHQGDASSAHRLTAAAALAERAARHPRRAQRA
jgi:hypothetical protein